VQYINIKVNLIKEKHNFTGTKESKKWNDKFY